LIHLFLKTLCEMRGPAVLRRFVTTSAAVDIRGFLSGLTHDSLGLTQSQAFDLLQGVSDSDVEEWYLEWRQSQTATARVVHSDELLSVLDRHEVENGVVRRTLHFNERLDLEQSSVTIALAADGVTYTDSDDAHFKAPRVDALPHHALVLATALRPARPAVPLMKSDAASILSSSNTAAPLRIAVLGAGGCSLPRWLLHALPSAEIEGVEASAAVAAVARSHFGAAALERTGRFTLRTQDAREWLTLEASVSESVTRVSWDAILLDVEAGDAEAGGTGRVAPPATFLSRDALLCAARALTPRTGVLAVNVVAPPEILVESATLVAQALAAEGAEVEPHAVVVARQRGTERHALLFSSPWLREVRLQGEVDDVSTLLREREGAAEEETLGELPAELRALAANPAWSIRFADDPAAWG
jgi:hypothetical protein